MEKWKLSGNDLWEMETQSGPQAQQILVSACRSREDEPDSDQRVLKLHRGQSDRRHNVG